MTSDHISEWSIAFGRARSSRGYRAAHAAGVFSTVLVIKVKICKQLKQLLGSWLNILWYSHRVGHHAAAENGSIETYFLIGTYAKESRWHDIVLWGGKANHPYTHTHRKKDVCMDLIDARIKHCASNLRTLSTESKMLTLNMNWVKWISKWFF